MKSYLDTLECLGYDMPNELGMSLILNSLNKDYDLFVQNYNMHSMGKTIAELHAMVKLHEKGIPKKAETPVVLAIREGRIQKDKKKPQGAKGKDKRKTNPEKDSVCHHCKEVVHWRRNCLSYHAELKKRKNASRASTSGIFTIELYAFPNKYWVYDTGYRTHICNTLHGLKGSKMLKHGALSVHVGNGMRATVEAIKSFDLVLPNIPKKAKTPAVLDIKEGRIQKEKKKPQGAKGKDNGKNKLAYAPKPKIPLPPKRDNLEKDSIYHHYKEVGHWRRNCPSYQAELKKKKNASGASTSGSRKWKHGALSLYVGNGMRAGVEAIRSFDLVLPSGLIIVLDNFHFAPTITRGVVSISRLVDNGYIHTFTNYGIFVSKDNVFYFNAIPLDGIYEIDMHNLYPNTGETLYPNNKRAKHELDSTYLWHCRLGHINKKCINKLQHDGILQPTHDESLEKCKSCIFGKMARKPFPHQVERAKDLLGLMHTDVCGPFRTVSRKGASYFITFTDDFNRYGEYLSHEFFNHMKSCGVVSQLTLPNTPQHNGVSKRRNRTLLDMVRSMINLTTLPKSFWGYALESASRIVNMVPTKKVDRTSYEICHGKAPKISYLEVWGCEETMGYYFYYPLENKIFITQNAEFFENSVTLQEASGSHGLLEASESDLGLELIHEDDTQPSEDTIKRHDEVEPNEHELGDLNEPPNYKAALLDPESYKWLDVMNTKMQSMKDNQVWSLVDLPPNGRTVGSK
ncbi:retrotransposon protein, putative, ty1-copia subclass [Tanacetum coccineum]